ncbi:MAG: EamA family transporter, partial [Lachnospiraceae bacterium]
IAAPIFLMIGLSMTTAANASLLNNFEIVATGVIALFIFKESISKRLWFAIVLVTISSILLSIEDVSSFSFSYGSIFVLLACICW